ncbi:MAG: TatD family deoxyribonuclease [Methylococcaceae bacterium]|nr:TatD family deoxyribonuclease [Methylococcaceae bacterium]
MTTNGAAFVDIHSHGSDSGFTIHCATTAELWGAADAYPRLSVGIHPWSIETADTQALLGRITELAARPAVWAIGECGLDKLIATPLQQQEALFRRQIEIAASVDKPLIVHCVRAHEDVLRLLKQTRATVPVIVHGYNNRPVIGTRLLQQGLLLSFGKALLASDSPARAMLAACPADRFFLETDDSGLPIEEIYRAAAACRSMPMADLKAMLWENLQRNFPGRPL